MNTKAVAVSKKKCLRAYFKCVEHIVTEQMRMKSLLTIHVHVYSTESVEPGLKKEDRQNTSEHARPTHWSSSGASCFAKATASWKSFGIILIHARSEGARLMQQVYSGRSLFLPSTVLGHLWTLCFEFVTVYWMMKFDVWEHGRSGWHSISDIAKWLNGCKGTGGAGVLNRLVCPR